MKAEKEKKETKKERERSDFPVHFSPYDLRFIVPTFLKGFRRSIPLIDRQTEEGIKNLSILSAGRLPLFRVKTR